MNLVIKKIQPLLLALVFCCVVAGALTWITFGVTGFGDDLKDRMQTIANEKAFDDQFSTLIKTVEDTESERAVLETFVLNDDGDTIALLSKLDEVARQQQVELSTSQLQVNENMERDGFNTLALGYKISGPESAVFKMIKIFETLPYHGQVTSLNYRRVIDEETKRVVQVEASILLNLSIKNYD